MPVQLNLSHCFSLFGDGSAFPFWLERLISKAELQPGNQVSKAKFNQVWFSASVTVARTDAGAAAAWQPLSPDKLRADLHTVFGMCLTLYILLRSFCGWACHVLLVPTPVAGCQCGPHFCAAPAWCECLSTSIRMGYSLVFSE